MKSKMKRNAAVTAAVFMLITVMAIFNRKDHLGVNAYASANIAEQIVASRQITRESLNRIEAGMKRQPTTIAGRLANGIEKGATELIETLSDPERLKNSVKVLLAPGYRAVRDVSYIVYPEKIRWAYEAEQPEWVVAALHQNKERYLADGSPVLDVDKGVNCGPSGLETYYNFDMTVVTDYLQSQGVRGYYHVREDGVKMYGDYIMVAANYNIHPYGSFVETSLGQGIVCDTGGFAEYSYFQLDIACDW